MVEKQSCRKSMILTVIFFCLLFWGLSSMHLLNESRANKEKEFVAVEFYKEVSQDSKGKGQEFPIVTSDQKNLAIKKNNPISTSEKPVEENLEKVMGESRQDSQVSSGGENNAGTSENGVNGTQDQGEGKQKVPRIASPQVLRRVEPIYPKSAIAQELSGAVGVSASITTGGTISSVSVVSSSGHSELDQAVVGAIWKWKFAPAKDLDSGQPVASRINLSVTFNLKK